MPNTTSATLAPATPTAPHTGKDDLWAPSALISLAVALAGLLAWVGKLNWSFLNMMRDNEEDKRDKVEFKARLLALEERTHQGELVVTRINAHLNSLEKSVDEIKIMLRRIEDNFPKK